MELSYLVLSTVHADGDGRSLLADLGAASLNGKLGAVDEVNWYSKLISHLHSHFRLVSLPIPMVLCRINLLPFLFTSPFTAAEPNGCLRRHWRLSAAVK